MSVSSQLYQLQELDLQIETSRQAIERLKSQVGESENLIKARKAIAIIQENLEELKRQQHTTEWEIDDLTNRITSAEEQLYNGKTTNPKELTSLQQEVGILKTNRSQLEDKDLDTMEQIEAAEAALAGKNNELKKIESEWQEQQRQLSENIEQLKVKLSNLDARHQQFIAQIDPQPFELYEELKKKKGTAVAKVEQGICRGCQISLSSAELQQARAGNMVQCSSCGRILYQP